MLQRPASVSRSLPTGEGPLDAALLRRHDSPPTRPEAPDTEAPGTEARAEHPPSLNPEGRLRAERPTPAPRHAADLFQSQGWDTREGRGGLLRQFFGLPREQLTVETLNTLLVHLQLGPTDQLLPFPVERGGSAKTDLDAFVAPTLVDRLLGLGMQAEAAALVRQHGGRPEVLSRVLCIAIRKGDHDQVRQWVGLGAPLLGYEGSTGPLAAVFQRNDPLMLNLLFELGLPFEGTGEENYLCIAGNPGPVRSPLLQSITQNAWACAELLIEKGHNPAQVEPSGLWFGSLLARYATLPTLEQWMLVTRDQGGWLIPWAPEGAECWIGTLLARGEALGHDALEEPFEDLTERLDVIERLARRRGESLSKTFCPVRQTSAMGVVAMVAACEGEVLRAKELFGSGSQLAGAARLGLAVWLERISRLQGMGRNATWMLGREVLEAWFPGCLEERALLINADPSPVAIALEGEHDVVLNWLIERGVPIFSRASPAWRCCLELEQFDRAYAWIEEHVHDPTWAAELLIDWSVAVGAGGRLPRFAASTRTVPIQRRTFSGAPYSGASLFRSNRPPASLLEGAPNAPSSLWTRASACVLLLLSRVGAHLRGWRDHQPHSLCIWRAFAAGRAELATSLLPRVSAWAVDRQGISLWSLLLCQANSEEREVCLQWRRGASEPAVCPQTGFTEGMSLLSTLIQLRAGGIELSTDLEALIWNVLQREKREGSLVTASLLDCVVTTEGRGLLHTAARGPRSTLFRLLELGLDPWACDPTGWSLGQQALKQGAAGLLETCVRQRPESEPMWQQILQHPSPCLTPSLLEQLRRAGHDLDAADERGQTLLAKCLLPGRIEALRWMLKQGRAQAIERALISDTSRIAHPLCQMWLLCPKGVRVLLEHAPAWASLRCPVQHCLPLQQALLADPVRALVMLQVQPELVGGAPEAVLERALEGRWADPELRQLVELLMRNGLTQAARDTRLLAHRRSALMTSLEAIPLPSVEQLAPGVRALMQGWIPVRRAGREWIIPMPAWLIPLPEGWTPNPEQEAAFSSRLAEVARGRSRAMNPHHPARNTCFDAWLREALTLPSDVVGEPWLLQRLREETLSALAPWIEKPCLGGEEAEMLLQFLKALCEQAPEWPLHLASLRLARQLHACEHQSSFLAVSQTLIAHKACARALQQARLSPGQKLGMLQHCAELGFITPLGVIELAPTPAVPEAERMRFVSLLRRKLSGQAVCTEWFRLIGEASATVQRQILEQRELTIERFHHELDPEQGSTFASALLELAMLRGTVEWPSTLWEELRLRLPLWWAQALYTQRASAEGTLSSRLLSSCCSWLIDHPDHERMQPLIVKLSSIIHRMARELEPPFGQWAGQVMDHLFELAPDSSRAFLRELTRLLQALETLHVLRLEVLGASGQLARVESTVLLGAGAPWLLEWAETRLPEGWEALFRSNSEPAP